MSVNVRGGSLSFEASISTANFDAQLKRIEQGLSRLVVNSEKQAQSVESVVKNATSAIAGYSSFLVATNFIRDVVKIRGEFQGLEVAFRTMLKSKDEADKLMKQVVDLAATTPFTLQDVGKGAQQLLAYGFAAKDITQTLTTLGNVSAGVGAPLTDIVYLYGTLKTQGQAFNKDILQFTGRGIPIIAELAKQFGVAESEVSKLVEQGKVGFPEVERAFRSMTEVGGTFFDLMGSKSKTLEGLVSNLEDAWSRMLDDIGKSNEDLFSGAISGATQVINNYKKVLDILKVLVATYGVYRAALIATSVATTVATNAAKGFTIAQTLQAQATIIAQRAMALLNSTLLKNPFAFAAAAVAALVTALVVFNKTADRSVQVTKDIEESQKRITDEFNNQKQTLLSYTEQLRKVNLSEIERRAIYEKLREINPDLVKGLNAQSISYDNLIGNLQEYLKLKEAEKNVDIDAVSRKAKQERLEEIKNEIDLLKERQAAALKPSTNSRIVGGSSFGVGNTGSSKVTPASKALADTIASRITSLKTERDKLQEEVAAAQLKANQGATPPPQVVRETEAFVKQRIADLEKEREATEKNSAARAEANKQLTIFRQKLRDIQAADPENISKVDDGLQQKRKAFEEKLAENARRISQLRLSDEEAAQAQIEAKYNDLAEEAKKLGISTKKVEAQLKGDMTAELKAANDNKALEQYKTFLNGQQEAYQRFEDLKVQYGSQRATELTNNQTGEFQSYIDFIDAELKKLEGDNTELAVRKRKELGQLKTNQEKSNIDKQIQEQISLFQRIEEETRNNAVKRAQIESQYQADISELRKRFTGEELAEREKVLTENRDKELTAVQEDANKYRGIFEKLNEDITNFTRVQIIAKRDELQKYLKENSDIPPIIKEAISKYLKELNGLISETSTSFFSNPKKWADASQALGSISQNFGQLASAVKDVNADLADTLQTMSDITSVASSVAAAVAGFASGNIIQGIAGTVAAIAGVFKLVSDAKKSVLQAQKEMEEFNLMVLQGEIDINEVYRERLVQQQKINQLRIQGLQAEARALRENQRGNQDDFTRILALLQKEQYISGQKTEQYGGFLGIGRKTRVVDVYSSLGGKSYEDLEKLFLSGRLEGKAKELFQTLEKLKKEGVDIDAALQQNANEAKEIFTGTTAESIADQIAQGFQNGLKNAADFANSFEDLMRGAIINALKYQTLEGPLKAFYEQFAKNAESDGVLTDQEIQQLRNNFNSIIQNAGDKFQELQKITDINFASGSAAAQSGLAGAIRGITAEQADLLAGQFGGLRITAINQLSVASQSLTSLQRIEINTNNLTQLHNLRQILERLELNGIKVK
jgi:hypothetical protein